jgi:hypothetical protein
MVNQYFYIKDVVKMNELNSVFLSKKHSNFEGNMADTKLNARSLMRVNKKRSGITRPLNYGQAHWTKSARAALRQER